MGLVVVTTLFLLLTIAIGRTEWGRGRFDQTGILSPLSGVDIRINELISGDTHVPAFVSRVFHNKLLGYGRELLHQYFIYFSGDFLFIKGGKSEAYAVPESGLLHITYLIPLFFLLVLLTNGKWMKDHYKDLLLITYFVLLAPLPAALTVVDAPNIQRSILMGLLLAIPIGLGMYSFWETTKKYKVFFVLLVVAIVGEMTIYMHNYVVHTDSFTSLYRNDGQRELISYLKTHPANTVYLPTYGTMSMYYLFYTADFSPSYAGQFHHDVKIDRIKNVVFMDTECPSEKVKLSPGDIVVDPIIACNNNWAAKYNLKAKITGKNNLIGFRVLEPRTQMSPTE